VPDLIHGNGNQLGVFDARIAFEWGSHIIFDSGIREHEPSV
jgi:hypothetical protein